MDLTPDYTRIAIGERDQSKAILKYIGASYLNYDLVAGVSLIIAGRLVINPNTGTGDIYVYPGTIIHASSEKIEKNPSMAKGLNPNYQNTCEGQNDIYEEGYTIFYPDNMDKVKSLSMEEVKKLLSNHEPEYGNYMNIADFIYTLPRKYQVWNAPARDQ